MTTLRAENLGKAYRIYRRPIDSLKELLLRRSYADTFWALKGVNLEVSRGASLGIVGDNGAGKTTLLKLLAGAALQTEGTLERNGRTSAILSLGAGFHPDLSGTDNIRIGCAVMGMSPAETEAVLPQIVDFSELGAFIERPVKTYSSGMYLRLGFSVATVTRPDLLIVDEHLSVGDQHFRHKCMRRIMDLREGGCSLVFCSHDLHAVSEVCERTLWLKDGRAEMLGPTDDVLKVYQDHVRASDGQADGAASADMRGGQATANAVISENRIVAVVLGGGVRDGEIVTGDRLTVTIEIRLSPSVAPHNVRLGVLIVRNDALWCYGIPTSMGEEGGPRLSALSDGRLQATMSIDSLPLLAGVYSLSVALLDGASPLQYDTWNGVAPFRVTHEGGEVGVARIAHRWEEPTDDRP